MAARGWELEELLACVRPAAPKVVLEIGTHRGESLRSWRTFLDPELLIGIQDTDETTPETVAELNAVLIRGRSQEERVFEEVCRLLHERGRERDYVDFLFIDGDHTLPNVLEDFMRYKLVVRPGGIIALDDSVLLGNDTVHVHAIVPAVSWGKRTKTVYGGHESGTGVTVIWT